MMRRFLLSTVTVAAFAAAVGLGFSTSARAGEGPAVEAQNWSFSGPFGQYDRAQLRRGFQVYREICANCHSMRMVAYRNLSDLGFSEDQIKAIAAEKEVKDGPNDEGEMFNRPARPADRFVAPFPNDQAARVANNGALPPDLSVIVDARHGGADYIFGLLTGFIDAPKDFVLAEGMTYNQAFPGNQIAMPPPIADDGVTYADGTKATKEQIARDVSAFLHWGAEPELDARHGLGFKVMAFVFALTLMFYALKRKIWADVH